VKLKTLNMSKFTAFDRFPRRRTYNPNPEKQQSDDSSDGTFKYTVLPPSKHKPFTPGQMFIPEMIPKPAGRRKEATRTTKGDIHMLWEETDPVDVEANTRATTSIMRAANQWSNDTNDRRIKMMEGDREHQERIQRNQLEYERQKQLVQARSNPEYMKYQLERQKEQNRYNKEMYEIQRKTSKEMAAYIANTFARDMKKNKDRKQKLYVETQDEFQQLLNDLNLDQSDLVGCNYKQNFCPSRESLYRTAYARTFLFWGVDRVRVDTDYYGYLIVYYRGKPEPVRVKFLQDGMIGFAYIRPLSNIKMCIVDVTETVESNKNVKQTLDFNGNLMAFNAAGKVLDEPKSKLCPIICPINCVI